LIRVARGSGRPGGRIVPVAVVLAVVLWMTVSRAAGPEPGEAEMLSNRGAVLAREGRYEEAAQAFRRAIRLAPDFAVAYFNLGLAERMLGDQESARRTLETAVRIRPDYSAAWLQLGRTLLTLERVDEGLQAFQVALGLTPRDPEALYWLGVASWRMRAWSSAATYWESLLQQHPDHGSVPKVWEDLPRAYYNLAASIHNTRPDEAATAYREALRLRPDYRDARIGLARVALGEERWTEAAEAYRRLLTSDPEDAAALRGLAVALASQDSLAASSNLYRTALNLDAGDLQARYGLAEVLLKQGKVDSARIQAGLIVKEAPTDPKSYKFRAFLDEQGKSGRRYGPGFRGLAAIAGYRKALELEPRDAGAHFNIGIIYGRRGQWQLAREAFLQALSIDSTHAGVRRWLPQVEAHLKEPVEVPGGRPGQQPQPADNTN
jgi:tetratricopeptide (TPR) repeat protein